MNSENNDEKIYNFIKTKKLSDTVKLVDKFKKFDNYLKLNDITNVKYIPFCNQYRKAIDINFGKHISILLSKTQDNYSVYLRFSQFKEFSIKMCYYVDTDDNLPLIFRLFKFIKNENDAKCFSNLSVIVQILNNLIKHSLCTNKSYKTVNSMLLCIMLLTSNENE